MSEPSFGSAGSRPQRCSALVFGTDPAAIFGAMATEGRPLRPTDLAMPVGRVP